MLFRHSQKLAFVKVIRRQLADKIFKTPFMPESITTCTVASWEKKVGDLVKKGENIASIETDKVEIPVLALDNGIIKELYCKAGETIDVGSNLYKLDIKSPEEVEKIAGTSKIQKSNDKEERKVEDKVQTKKDTTAADTKEMSNEVQLENETKISKTEFENFERQEKTIPMNRIRLRIAERMKQAQNTAASLTTFNEVDMSEISKLRTAYKQDVLEKHKIKLGFMSFFVKACATSLSEMPIINARIEQSAIIYPNFADISVAVATAKGLVTPVIKNCHMLGLLDIERTIHELAAKAREGRITLDDLSGGTFTISNGGVFGSLNGTPILNTPQSAILGMHAIKERPIVVQTDKGAQIVARPMMNLALTYDHRLIDGREAVAFLLRIKQLIEEPQRMLFDI